MQEKYDRRILYARKNDKRTISQKPFQMRFRANKNLKSEKGQQKNPQINAMLVKLRKNNIRQ